MASTLGGERPPPTPNELTFTLLVRLLNKAGIKPDSSIFVNKLSEILEVVLPTTITKQKALAMSERGLIGQFIGIWPSTRSM